MLSLKLQIMSSFSSKERERERDKDRRAVDSPPRYIACLPNIFSNVVVKGSKLQNMKKKSKFVSSVLLLPPPAFIYG